MIAKVVVIITGTAGITAQSLKKKDVSSATVNDSRVSIV
jgi:hypothetical protein